MFVDGWSITAWWVGLITLAICLCLTSLLMLLFPHWLKEPNWLLVRRLRHVRYLEKRNAYEKELRRKRRERRRRKRRKARARAKRKAEEEERRQRLAEGGGDVGSAVGEEVANGEVGKQVVKRDDNGNNEQKEEPGTSKDSGDGEVGLSVPNGMVNGEDANHHSDGNVTEDEGGDMTEDSGGNVTEDEGGNVTEDSGGNMTEDEGQGEPQQIPGHASTEISIPNGKTSSPIKSHSPSSIEVNPEQAIFEQDQKEEKEYQQHKRDVRKKKRQKLGRKLRGRM